MTEREKSQEKVYMEEKISQKIDIDTIDIHSIPPAEEPARQYYYIKKCRLLLQEIKEREGRELTCNVTNFGCQMNTEVEIEKAA